MGRPERLLMFSSSELSELGMDTEPVTPMVIMANPRAPTMYELYGSSGDELYGSSSDDSTWTFDEPEPEPLSRRVHRFEWNQLYFRRIMLTLFRHWVATSHI